MPLTPFWHRHPTRWTAVDAGVPGELLRVTVDGKATTPRVLQAQQCLSDRWSALPELLKDGAGRDGATVAVLPRGDYQIVQLPKPPVPAAELERSVRWAVASLVDMPPEAAVIQTLAVPTAPDAQESLLYAVACPQTATRALDAQFKACRWRLDAIDIRETAQRNLTALAARDETCVCSLRVTPLGVQLVFCLGDDMLLDRFVAQPLTALQADDAFDRQRALERIAQQFAMSVNLMKERYPAVAVSRVLLCPSPVAAATLQPLEALLNVPLTPLDMAALLDLSAVPALQATAEQARFFVALGAALRGRGS